MIGLAVFGLWALTPYLYSRQVDEAFPAANPAATSAPAAVVEATNAPTTIVEATSVPAVAEATSAPTTIVEATSVPAVAEATSAPAITGPLALSAGTFISGSFPGDTASGRATIYRIDGGQQLLRLEDFATTNGPDLFVVLSGSANPDADGVKAGAFLQLAALKGNQGNQNYELPADIDLSQYKSVVVWCRAFNIVFGYATLQAQ
ncbi:MAG: DM13 domain-containing protein [Chloroflexales bacterium]|nr:DM13 domain-containing protein [Chloroflexales bacterium]